MYRVSIKEWLDPFALTIISAIDEPAVIAKILAHLGLPTRPPPRSHHPRHSVFPEPPNSNPTATSIRFSLDPTILYVFRLRKQLNLAKSSYSLGIEFSQKAKNSDFKS